MKKSLDIGAPVFESEVMAKINGYEVGHLYRILDDLLREIELNNQEYERKLVALAKELEETELDYELGYDDGLRDGREENE